MDHLARYKLQSDARPNYGNHSFRGSRDKKTFFSHLRPIPDGRIPEVAAKGTARIGGYLISVSSKGDEFPLFLSPLHPLLLTLSFIPPTKKL